MAQEPEKPHTATDMVEDAGYASKTDSVVGDDDPVYSPEEQRKIIHRIDRRLVSTVGAMYCISLMDRTNLSAAAIAGMTKDLKLSVGFRYSIITLVFFTTYIVFQPPSTVIVRKIGPRIHISLITFLWGALMIGMGFVKTWKDLAALRVVLGILEAGFFPSSVYLLSTWYVRYDMGKRYSFFYIIGSVASACAGILAFGLMQMNGLQGYAGWRWIFIIEGTLTCCLGIAGYWLVVGFPDDAQNSWKFLSQPELDFIIRRVNKDRGDAKVQPFKVSKFLRAGLDLKIWGFAMLFFNTTTMTYALAYFLPIILRDGMGFSVGAAQCLVAPPYAFAGIITYITGWLGDKYRVRGPIIAFNMLLCLIGLPIMGFHKKAGVRYFGIFLTTAGANANVPAVLSYQANNIRGQWKRAFCSASLVGFGGIGGIAGSLVFRSQDSPRYHPGLYACITCCLLTLVIVASLSVKFYFDNKKQARGELVIEDSDEDHQQGFRYTF